VGNYLCIHFTITYAKLFFGEYYNNQNFKTVSHEDDTDVKLNDYMFCMSDIYRQLQNDWKPDIIFVSWPEWHALPKNLFFENTPIVALISDWNLAFLKIKNHLHLYDCVFMDKNGTDLFNDLGYKNVHYLPLYSYDPQLHFPDESVFRDIDISLVGNISHEVQVERIEWLKRLVMLKKEGLNVQIISNVYGKEYTKILQRSKMVFNRGIRSEMNLRAYEAPAAGALLLMEEKNVEISEHLTRFNQYIPYNETNFFDLVKYYSEHNSERDEISKQAYLSIINTDSYTHHFTKIIMEIDKLSSINQLFVRERKLIEDDYKGLITQAIHSIQGYTLDLCFKLLEDATLLFNTEKSAWWLNTRAYLYFLKAKSIGADLELSNSYLNKSIMLWNDAINMDRTYFLSMFNLYVFYYQLNQDHLVQAMADILTETCVTSEIIGFEGIFFVEHFYDNFRVENERARYSSNIKSIIKSNLVNVFLSEIYEILGKSYERTGNVHEATLSFKRSISHRTDNVIARVLLSSILIRQNQFIEAVLHLKMTLSYNPFQIDAAFELCKILKVLGPIDEFIKLAEEYVLICDSISIYSTWKRYFEVLLEI
jgi:spore maturation protein CgeB